MFVLDAPIVYEALPSISGISASPPPGRYGRPTRSPLVDLSVRIIPALGNALPVSQRGDQEAAVVP
jgi:hypothetical protein